MRDTAAASLSNALEQLKVDFTMDMIGNGPFKKNWGMINLMLCDTDADPLTTHIRQTNRNTLFFKKKNVDFYVNADDSDELDARYAKLKNQHGAYPQYVGEWLFDPILKAAYDAESSISFSNDYRDKKVVYKENYGGGNFDVLGQYSFGYNYRYKVDYTDNQFKVIRRPRKKDADISMHFQDNGFGDTEFGYGFKLNAFFHDIEKKDGEFVNTQHDTTRGRLFDLRKTFNFAAIDEEERKKDNPDGDTASPM